MSDYNNEFRREPVYDPNARGLSSSGRWLAGAAVVAAVVVLLVVFGHPANQGTGGSVNNAPPPVTHTMPAPGAPVTPTAPMAPAPGSPAHP